MPVVSRLLETSLYVDDVERSTDFYQRVLGFVSVVGVPVEGGSPAHHLCPLQMPGGQVLLLFAKGSTTTQVVLPGGTIPSHDGHGRLHLAFAISAADMELWRERLSAHGVTIESEMIWPRGGTSLYFRDPDGHLVELATPGIWPIF